MGNYMNPNGLARLWANIGKKFATIKKVDALTAADVHARSDKWLPIPPEIGAKSNENLLRNWYFADPVDQRGGWLAPPGVTYYADSAFTTVSGTVPFYQKIVEKTNTYAKYVGYSSGIEWYIKAEDAVRGYTGAGYTIDGWRGIETVLIEDGGLKIEAGQRIIQYLDNAKNLDGKVITASVLVGSELLTGSLTFDSLNTNTNYFCIGALRVYASGNFIGIYAPNAVSGIKAAKLELGSVQTLAHQDENGKWVLNDPPPDKALELLKCCMSTANSADDYANNKKTPAAINAVNKVDPNGDTMAGTLRTGGGYSRFVGNPAYAGFSHQKDPKNDGSRLWLGAYYDGINGSLLRLVKYKDNVVEQDNAILHTGNTAALKYPKMEVASYVGTGTYGKDNPCSVTFSFAPKIVVATYTDGGRPMFQLDAGDYLARCNWMMLADVLTTEFKAGVGFGTSVWISSRVFSCYGKKSEDGKTFSWYQTCDDGSDCSTIQLNSSGATMNFVGLGF